MQSLDGFDGVEAGSGWLGSVELRLLLIEERHLSAQNVFSALLSAQAHNVVHM